MTIYNAEDLINPAAIIDIAWREYHTLDIDGIPTLVDGSKIPLIRLKDIRERIDHLVSNRSVFYSVNVDEPDALLRSREVMASFAKDPELSRQLKEDSEEFIRLSILAQECVEEFVGLKYNVDPEELENESMWAELGPNIAEELAVKEALYANIIKKPLGPKVDHHARAIHFDLVKEKCAMIYSMKDKIKPQAEFPLHLSLNSECISHISIRIDNYADREYFLKLGKGLSDQKIYTCFVEVLNDPTHKAYQIFAHAEKILKLKYLLNFKSIERSLATGRRQQN